LADRDPLKADVVRRADEYHHIVVTSCQKLVGVCSDRTRVAQAGMGSNKRGEVPFPGGLGVSEIQIHFCG
jgi:hypothetical protein